MRETQKTQPRAAEVQAANLPDNLPLAPFEKTVRNALENCTDVDSLLFENDELSGCNGVYLEFSGCLFRHCTFSDWEFKRISFVDCVLEQCDLSGLRLENVTFQRIRVTDCRLLGAEMLKAVFKAVFSNVLWHGCNADYLAFSESKCTRVEFTECRFHESTWQDITLKATVFDHCDFTSSTIRHMPLAGLNLTTCVLDSLQIDPFDLRGLKVTPLQGLAFCSLLGLVITDAPIEKE